MNTLLTIDVIGLALFAWFSAFKIVPACILSHHRYQLWRLRDKLADEIRQRAFRDDQQPRKVLALIEGSIECLQELSALNALLLHISSKGARLAQEPWDLAGVVPADKEIIGQRTEELERIIAKHALLGTPSGWVCLVVLSPVALVAVLMQRLKGGGDGGESLFRDATLHLQEEFEIGDSVIALIRRRPSRPRRSLYHRV